MPGKFPMTRRMSVEIAAVAFCLLFVTFLCQRLAGQQGDAVSAPPPVVVKKHDPSQTVLTAQEQAFLKEHPVITVAVDRSAAPIEFMNDQGQNVGLSFDYLKEMTKKFGMTFDVINFSNRPTAFNSVKTGKVDMFAAISPDRIGEGLIYTKPYLSLPIVVYTQMKKPYVHDLEDLAGKNVGVVNGNNYVSLLEKQHKSLQLVYLRNAEEGMQKLMSGEIDAFLGNMLTTGWAITSGGYTHVQISGRTDYKVEVCMATRKSMTVLRGILQKGLDSMTPQQVYSIQNDWMKIEYKRQTDRRTLWALLGLSIFMTLLFVIWNHRLRREAIRRQRMTDEMRQNEEYLQSVFDTMSSGVMLIDPRTFCIEQVNDYACKLIGLPREKIVGRICNDFVCPAERGHCPVVAMGGNMELTERSLIDCTGKMVPILKAVVRIKHGGKDMFLETFTDMTQVKKAEMQIQADEDKYRSLFEMSREATIVSRNMHIIECNDAAVSMFGYESKDEMLKLGPLDLSSPQQAGGQSSEELLNELAADAATGSLPLMEWQFRRKDGSTFTGEVLTSPAIVDGTPAVQGNIRDVSVRKAIEMERGIFQQAIVNAPVSVVITDADGSIEYVNPFFTKVTGYELYEVLGKNPRVLQSGRTSKDVYEDMWATLGAGRMWSGHFYNRTKDGREFNEYALITPIVDSDGKIIHYLAVKQDVTEREELREKVENLARFPSENPNPVFRMSADGIVLYANAAGREFLKLWNTAIGQLAPDDFPQIVKEVFEAKTVRQVAMPAGDKYYSISFASIGVQNCVNAYAHDVTELRKISNERDRLFNNSVDMLCIGGLDGYFKEVNPAWTKVLGWTAHELTCRKWIEFVHPDDIAATQANEEKLAHGHVVNGFENRFICKDGTYRWMSWNIFAMQDEGMAFGVARDITEIKKQRELLQESQERFSLALEGAALGLWDWNVRTNENFINDRWAEMLGYTRDEIIQTFPDTANLLHPEDRPKMQEQLEAHLAGNTDYYRCRFRMKTKSGEYKWIWSVGRVMERDKNGNPLRVLGVHQDIDEQKRIEDELIRAKIEAEEANQAKSLFLANMSHEIRTPMNAILGYTQLMQRDAGLSDVQHKYLEIINHSGTHLLSLINDILEMSKIEAGRARTNSVIFDFTSMLQDIEMMFHVRTAPQNVMLRTVVKSEVPRYIKSDESKIRQILINLIGNAVKFTSSGHIIITVDCKVDNPEPAADIVRNIKFKVDVEDTGCGIALEDMQKIFEAFEQTHTAIERGGTGLGLPISREYARMLDGDITATSEPGLGSTFTFTFTAQYVEEPQQATVESQITNVVGLAAGRDSASVLVVDDKENNRTVLVNLLAGVGFFVRSAENGCDALDIVKQWQPDVILMDRRMPMMDGYEAMRKIKDMPQGKKIPVLIVTASALEENRSDALGYGADGFIRKPYNEKEIFDAIRRVTGIEYVYDGGEAGEGLGDYRPSPEEINALPEELRSGLKLALNDGDVERINIFIGRISDENKSLGTYLLGLAEHYEYAKLQKLLALDLNEK